MQVRFFFHRWAYGKSAPKTVVPAPEFRLKLLECMELKAAQTTPSSHGSTLRN